MDHHKPDTHLHLEDIAMEAKLPLSEARELDPAAEKKLLRKLDLRILPALWLLFLLAFLDRTNIGYV